MLKKPLTAALSAAMLISLNTKTILAESDIDLIREEINQLKQSYESRISDLESKLESAIQALDSKVQTVDQSASASGGRVIRDNAFNPSVGVILSGTYREHATTESEIAGFAIGEEGERPDGGFGLNHSEFNFSANVDDKFTGSTTFAIAEHEGATEVELEEAYIMTLPGAGTPDGITFKFGRAFWTLGYLNEQHAHTDDFVDRPLPYRAFVNHSYNDDGIEITKLLPTDIYSEVGVGLFRGNDFPFGGPDGEGSGAMSAFYRIGGDLGTNKTWRLGMYQLNGEAPGGRTSNEDTVTFTGDVDMTVFDLRYTYAPTGNPRDQEITFTAEHFSRDEDGTYEDTGAATGTVNFTGEQTGWYAAGVYKFSPKGRIGIRYSELKSNPVPVGLAGSAIDSGGFNPNAISVMADWTNSEFSRIRFQVNKEDLAANQSDDQVLLQYIMSFGAHGAHKY